MTAYERILSLKLYKAQEKQKEFMNELGLSVSIIETRKSKIRCNNFLKEKGDIDYVR